MRASTLLLLFCSCLLVLAGCRSAASAAPSTAQAPTPTSTPSPTSTPLPAPPGACPQLPAAQPGPAPAAATSLYATNINPDRLASLNLNNGAVRWQEEVGGGVVVVQNVTYVEDNGVILALNASDGALRWCDPEGSQLNSSIVEGFLPMTADQQMVYAGGVTGNIIGVDASNGKRIWLTQAQVRGEVLSLAVADGLLYVVSAGYGTGHTFSAFHASDGKLVWQFYMEQGDFMPPAIVNGVVYVAQGGEDTPAYLYALDAATGAVRWRIMDQQKFTGFGSLIVQDGVIYTTDDMDVYAFNASDGSQRWSLQEPSYISAEPVLANGVLYIGTSDSDSGSCVVEALNASNGALRWKTEPPSFLAARAPLSAQTPGPCGSGLSILGVAGGAVYTAEIRASIALNASNGRQLWTSDWSGIAFG